MRCILFIPVSGAAGSGEVQRCRLLADALHAAAPDIQPHFLLAPGLSATPWPLTTLPASPTRAVAEVAAAIRALRPAVVVFDGNARVAAMDAARAVGARVVTVSSRPSARNRGFRLRRMARMDEHWIVGADQVADRGWRERLATRLRPGVVVRRFATLFAAPASPAGALRRLGASTPYVVVCAGGGRHDIAGRSSAELFGEAATAAATMGLTALAVAATAAAPAIAAGELDNAELMALLSQAEAALLAGGSLLVQALALGVPALALPMQQEQAARIAWLAERGAVVPLSTVDATALAAALHDLATDAAARDRLRQAAASLGLRNGLPGATAALVALVRGESPARS